MEETGCKITCGAQTTLTVKGQRLREMVNINPRVAKPLMEVAAVHSLNSFHYAAVQAA